MNIPARVFFRTVGDAALAASLLVLSACATGSQGPDTEFRYPIETPRYTAGSGPRVAIDASHDNFHTVDGRFGPFAQLLRDDGYTVESFDEPWSIEALAEVDVLVIANALAEDNRRRWRLPNPSAFTDAENQLLRDWIESGGSLLLIADHLPFPGAAETLAAELGVFFMNGYARDGDDKSHILYRREEGNLRAHPITDGTGPDERVDVVKVFTGQAFRVSEDADFKPLMVFGKGSKVVLPSKPRVYNPRTPYVLAEGLLQGATLRLGEGRVAVFGEAGMFTAQVSITRASTTFFGMSDPEAEDNARFVLNVLHWLTQGDSQ